MRGLTADSLAGGLTLSSLLRRFYLSTLGCGSPKSLSRCTMALGVCVFVEKQTRTDRPGSVERAVRAGPGRGESERLAREGESG